MTDYKAIIFDLDGTAIPNSRDGMPSERLIKAVTKAKTAGLHLIAATARPSSLALPVIQALKLQDPCVICGGTIIIDPLTGEPIRESNLNQTHLDAITEVFVPYPYKIATNNDAAAHYAVDRKLTGEVNILFVAEVESRDLTNIIQKLSHIPGIFATSTKSWTTGHVIHVTTKDGSKEHGIGHVLKMLDISPEEAIGVGDGDNDIHLFAAVGHRIAMGNASEQLKSIADEVAPTINDDGLAWVIERYLK